jgi:hypothetical protein
MPDVILRDSNLFAQSSHWIDQLRLLSFTLYASGNFPTKWQSNQPTKKLTKGESVSFVTSAQRMETACYSETWHRPMKPQGTNTQDNTIA